MQTKQDIFDSISICIKRGPYIDYSKHPETVEKVLFILRNYEERTMYDWLKRIRINNSYNPLDKQIRPNARIFSEEEEDLIALNILEDELGKGNCFCDIDATILK